MIHHITYEVEKSKLADEKLFWSCLGWTETGLRRRSRKQPPIQWLVNGDEDFAIELIPVGQLHRPFPPDLGHICLSMGQRRWQIARDQARLFHFLCEEHPEWGSHAFFHSPQGYIVEAAEALKSIKSGPPLEEN